MILELSKHVWMPLIEVFAVASPVRNNIKTGRKKFFSCTLTQSQLTHETSCCIHTYLYGQNIYWLHTVHASRRHLDQLLG